MIAFLTGCPMQMSTQLFWFAFFFVLVQPYIYYNGTEKKRKKKLNFAAEKKVDNANVQFIVHRCLSIDFIYLYSHIFPQAITCISWPISSKYPKYVNVLYENQKLILGDATTFELAYHNTEEKLKTNREITKLKVSNQIRCD